MIKIYLGIIFGVVLTLLSVAILKPSISLTPNTRYEFVDSQKRIMFSSYLEEHDILYKYEINEFKRHYIQPLISTREMDEKLSKVYFNNEYINE